MIESDLQSIKVEWETWVISKPEKFHQISTTIQRISSGNEPLHRRLRIVNKVICICHHFKEHRKMKLSKAVHQTSLHSGQCI